MPRLIGKFPQDDRTYCERIDGHLNCQQADRSVAASMAIRGYSTMTVWKYSDRATRHGKAAQRLLECMNAKNAVTT